MSDKTQTPVLASVGGSGAHGRRARKVEGATEENLQNEGEEGEEGERNHRGLSCEQRSTEWLARIGNIQEMGYMFVIHDDDTARSGLRLAGVSANVTSADWWRHERSAEDLLGSDMLSVFHEECVERVSALVRRHKASLDPCAQDREDLISAEFCPFPDSEREFLTCNIAPSNTGVCLLEVELAHGLEVPARNTCPDSSRWRRC